MEVRGGSCSTVDVINAVFRLPKLSEHSTFETLFPVVPHASEIDC